jgi:multisubunit Na+/H+ antiporter MnhC subunit
VSFLGPAGTCVLDANQAGDTTYAAAATAQQTITVNKASQTITFTSTPPSSPKVGGTYLVTATSSSQLVVAIAIDTSSTSICSISSGKVTFLQAGTCVIDANQAGDTSFLAAPQSQQSFTISKVPQTITFTSTPPKSAKIGGTYAVTATSTSHLVVAITIDTSSTSICSISSGKVTFHKAGTCVLDANQAGNSTFLAAPQVRQSFTVSKDAQTITFTSKPPSSPKVGGTYLVTATSSSQLVVAITIDTSSTSICSISSGKVTFLKAGTCVVDANQAGSSTYLAAPQVHQTITVA